MRGARILDTGHWKLDTGHWTLDTGHWMLKAGFLCADCSDGSFSGSHGKAPQWAKPLPEDLART